MFTIVAPMSLKHLHSKRVSGQKFGFSVIEMVLFLAILGIICGMGIVQFAALRAGAVDETRYKRNAQELASVCTAAQAAGLDFVGNADLQQTIRNVIQGGAPSDGAFSGKLFAVKALANTDITRVARYLSIEGGTLVYHAGAEF